MSVIAEVDGREVRVDGDFFVGSCVYCGWGTNGFADRRVVSVILALHECSPLIDRCVNCGYEVVDDGGLRHVYNGLMGCPNNGNFYAELADNDPSANFEDHSYFDQ